MLPRAARFSRTTFPKKRPLKRLTFNWGSVSLYDSPPGVGVVVSKKVLSSAVLRNRAKRRLYRSVATVLGGSQPAHGLVIYPRRDVLTVPTNVLVNDLANALKSTK